VARPRIRQQLLEKTRGQAIPASSILQDHIAGLEETKKLLDADVEHLRDEVLFPAS
jgi:hypothetical protein